MRIRNHQCFRTYLQRHTVSVAFVNSGFIDGNVPYVELPHLNYSRSFTFAAWISVASENVFSSDLTVVGQRRWARLFVQDRQQLAFAVDSGLPPVLVDTAMLVPNRWTFVAVTVSEEGGGSRISLYREVQPPVSILRPGSFYPDPDSSSPAIIGSDEADGTHSEAFAGSLDAVRIYDRALSANEISVLYRENE
ncbi:MAG: hypothetical protein RIS76_4061 [Verrucomicrobiota bacterium]